MQDIYIIGASGHGREVLWLVQSLIDEGADYRLRGFVDDNSALHGSKVCGQPVLGPLEMLADVGSAAVALGIGLPAVKRKVLRKLEGLALEWPALVAPSVRMSEHVDVGRGVTICAGSVVTTQVTLGDFALVNVGCTISHDVMVGRGTMLSPGTHLTGGVTVGDWADLGAGVDVIPGVHIGDEAVVGAGAVVIRDVPDGATVVGNPARVLKKKEVDGTVPPKPAKA